MPPLFTEEQRQRLGGLRKKFETPVRNPLFRANPPPQAAERKMRMDLPEKEYAIGEASEKGIYLGTWAPVNRYGKNLGKIFNVFAAPEDLTDDAGRTAPLHATAAIERVASLKNWHGYDGANFLTDGELYNALEDGHYDGAWFIPPRELVDGKNIEDKSVQDDCLLAHQDKGDFKGTFARTWYWSCTEANDADTFRVALTSFVDGTSKWYHAKSFYMNSRPVRLEPR